MKRFDITFFQGIEIYFINQLPLTVHDVTYDASAESAMICPEERVVSFVFCFSHQNSSETEMN